LCFSDDDDDDVVGAMLRKTRRVELSGLNSVLDPTSCGRG